MTKLQIVQRFANEFSFLVSHKDAAITLVNDKIFIDNIEANEEMQEFYSQLTNDKIDEAVKLFNSTSTFIKEKFA